MLSLVAFAAVATLSTPSWAAFDSGYTGSGAAEVATEPAARFDRPGLVQNDAIRLPPYISRRGELRLWGPDGLVGGDTQRIRIDMKPDADHLLNFRLQW